MVEARHLADQLSAFFRGPQPWIYPFADSIDDLTAAQAVVVPALRMNSVVAVAYHVAFWHEVVLRRLRGSPVDEEQTRSGGWPEPTAYADEDRWRELRHRLAALNTELTEIVASLDDNTLAEQYAAGRATRWQLISGLIAHTAYHTAEVACVRQLQGLWDRP